MGTFALMVAALVAVEPTFPDPQSVEDAVAEPSAPEVPADQWAGENKRVHWGLGLRAHVGLMQQGSISNLLVQSGLIAFVSVRTFGHQEAAISFELSGGIPDTVSGETLITYRFHLTPRFSVGAAAIFFWGFWSLRGGVEVPFTIRLGDSRRHEIGLALRTTAGVYNNVTYVWWDFEKQRFAIAADFAVTYAFIF